MEVSREGSQGFPFFFTFNIIIFLTFFFASFIFSEAMASDGVTG
jgi:hypothetical protein